MQKIKIFNNKKEYMVVNKSIRFFFRKYLYTRYLKNTIKSNIIIINNFNLKKKHMVPNFFLVSRNQKKINNYIDKVSIGFKNYKYIDDLSKFFILKNIMLKGGNISYFFLWIYKIDATLFREINKKPIFSLFRNNRICYNNRYNWSRYFVIKRTGNTKGINYMEPSLYTFQYSEKAFISIQRKNTILAKKRFCFLRKTKNNYFLTITNGLGDVILRKSAGLVKVKSKKRKKSRDTFALICNELAADCFNLKIKKLDKLIITHMGVFFTLIYTLTRAFKRIGLMLQIPLKVDKVALKNKRNKNFKKVSIVFGGLCFIRRRAHNGIRKKKTKRL